MPYVSKRIPAVVARAYVMRVEGCDKAAAMRQIEAAALDGALRWVRRGSSRWDWDAEVFRTDLLKLWPMPSAEQDLPVLLGDAAAPAAAGRTSDVRYDVKAASAWLEKPVPDRAELQPLRVMRARLRNTVQAAIQEREPADIADDKCQEAAKDVDERILAWLADSQLAAFLETQHGLERLPYGLYWVSADGRATEDAKRVFAEGAAASNHYPRREGGVVMVHVGEFEAIAEQYLAAQGVGKYQISSATPHRFEDPVWNLRDVFGWVLDRDRVKFGRIHGEGDWRSAEWAVKRYPTMPRPEHDPQAGQTLLHALQKGDLAAYRGTNPVSRDFWIDKTPQYIRDSSDFLFRREHVLARWPDPRAPIEALETEKPSERPGAKPEQVLRTPAPRPGVKRAGGRKIGSGSIDDAMRLRAMLCLLACGKAPSVLDAARKVAETIEGSSQSRSADVARLRRKFAEAYGTEPQAGTTWADLADKLNAN